eukprot:9557114-Alexandrium_andersonii.AAC.1
MEEDLQPRRDEVFSISGPALQCPSALGAEGGVREGADAASRTGRDHLPEQYFVASEDESET